MASKFEDIREKDIMDMLFLIQAHAGRVEAKRFNALRFDKKQKVTYILKSRARRSRNAEAPIDIFQVREVLNYANQGIFDLD